MNQLPSIIFKATLTDKSTSINAHMPYAHKRRKFASLNVSVDASGVIRETEKNNCQKRVGFCMKICEDLKGIGNPLPTRKDGLSSKIDVVRCREIISQENISKKKSTLLKKADSMFSSSSDLRYQPSHGRIAHDGGYVNKKMNMSEIFC